MPNVIDEAAREFYLGDEEKLKKTLIRMLINKDGKYGPYKHPKYAERLSKYILKIVPIDEDPKTAAVSFDKGIVYVNEGFLTDPDNFYQLNVIMRHELAHNLLMHQIRMMHKLGPEFWEHLSTSHLFMDVLNVIMDFEISNRKYTSEDKRIMQNLKWATEEIHCLVTEMHRKDWQKLTLEEMYDELTKEIEDLQKAKKDDRENPDSWWKYRSRVPAGFVRNEEEGLLTYTDLKQPSLIWVPADEFFKKSKKYKKMAPAYAKLLKDCYDYLVSQPIEAVEKVKDKIINSMPAEKVLINSDIIVYTPEEKYLAMQAVKYLLGICVDRPKTTITRETHSDEYKKMYNEIIKSFGKTGEFTAEEIGHILDDLASKIKGPEVD